LSISAVTGKEPAPVGCGSFQLNILSVRRLDTGAVRVRDGQTIHYRLASPEIRTILATLHGIYCAPQRT
jgi:hypothetical protein